MNSSGRCHGAFAGVQIEATSAPRAVPWLVVAEKVQNNRVVVDRVWPSSAEALMRSRFEAFREGDAEWLLISWHPSTRPNTVDLTNNPKWRGLQIVDVVGGTPDDATGVVEFRATYMAAPSDVRVLHERSRFVREGGRWYYLDADEHGESRL